MLRHFARLQQSSAQQGKNLAPTLYSSFASKSGGKNVAQGDTTVPAKAKEVANTAKGGELVKSENLQYNTITHAAQAFENDLRSTSGLGLGDGLSTHTSKWLDTDGMYAGNTKSPMDYILESKPIKVHGAVVASYGSDNPALGCPVEYISLKGTSKEHPAVCKYTGNKYYSDDWHLSH